MIESTVSALLELIDGLDRIDPHNYVDISRFDESSGNEDLAIVRQLAHERLGTFAIEDVGMEVLRRINTRAAT